MRGKEQYGAFFGREGTLHLTAFCRTFLKDLLRRTKETNCDGEKRHTKETHKRDTQKRHNKSLLFVAHLKDIQSVSLQKVSFVCLPVVSLVCLNGLFSMSQWSLLYVSVVSFVCLSGLFCMSQWSL